MRRLLPLRSIEVVEDRTAQSRSDEGFLRVARMLLRNHYADGSRSQPYPCDVLSRPGSDAVVAALYEIDGQRRVRVLLRDAPRAAIEAEEEVGVTDSPELAVRYPRLGIVPRSGEER